MIGKIIKCLIFDVIMNATVGTVNITHVLYQTVFDIIYIYIL